MKGHAVLQNNLPNRVLWEMVSDEAVTGQVESDALLSAVFLVSIRDALK
jgi:hypothetical protein